MVTRILSRYHYKKIDLNDSLSSVIFDNYIKSLDYNKSYFLKSDIDKFEKSDSSMIYTVKKRYSYLEFLFDVRSCLIH